MEIRFDELNLPTNERGLNLQEDYNAKPTKAHQKSNSIYGSTSDYHYNDYAQWDNLNQVSHTFQSR